MVSIKSTLTLFIVLLYSPSSFGIYHEDLLSKNPNITVHETHARGIRALKRVNVDDFGAKGDGTDDSKAFRKAWDKACSSKGSVFVVPFNKVYHLKPINFSGPCHSHFTTKIYGTIKASTNHSDYEQDQRHWLVFENLHKFTFKGGGTINGNGKKWWENSCKINESMPCKGAPTAVTFKNCSKLRVKKIRMKNSQQMHMAFVDCHNVKASNLLVVAPEKSPNTDGIHITGTRNIHVSKSIVRTGDDCVSIVNGSKNVLITNLKCGPGHGISIGSLGKNKAKDHVSYVMVNRAILSNTTNGVRIKTWQGGSGYAANIKFINIVMHNVSNPIIINQNYCDRKEACPQQHEAVQVKDVVYKNIRGTSESEMAIKFNCSKSFPCQGIQLRNVRISLERGDHGDAKASCTNVRPQTIGKNFPKCI